MIGPRGGGRIIQISSMGGQIAIPTHSAYHAAKWRLRLHRKRPREVAGFGVPLTHDRRARRRPHRLRVPPAVYRRNGPYRETAVGQTRRFLEATGPEDLAADPAKLADVIWETTRREDPPTRIALGSDTYDAVHAAPR